MTENEPEEGAFQKVAECLYRHKSSGTYYGLVKRSGKQYRRSLKTANRKLAERFLGEFRRKVDRLDHTKASSDTMFAECAKLWLATVVPHMKLSSALRRETSVAQINPYLGSVVVRNLTSNTCESWAAKRGAGIAASTYNNERDTIIAVLNYAKREGLLLDNPALVLPRRKLGKSNIVIPSKAEFEMLVRKLRSLDVRYQEGADLVELLAYSGLRLTEATSLRWKDIDFAGDRFKVTGGETGTKNHEERIVPLFPAMRAFLEHLRSTTTPKPDARIIGILKATGWQTDVHVESGGLVSKLYKLNDTYRVQYDEGLCAASSTLDAAEGKRHRDTKVTFDAATKKATYLERDLINNTVFRSSVIDVPACVQDVIGTLMKLRTLNLAPGQSVKLPISDGKKFVNARVEAQEHEEIKTKLGVFKTTRYEAFLFNGALYTRSARLFVWLTDDARRLPVQIRVRLQFVIGTITLTLEKDGTS